MERLKEAFGEKVVKLFDLMLETNSPSIQLTYLREEDRIERGDLIPLVTFSIGVAE